MVAGEAGSRNRGEVGSRNTILGHIRESSPERRIGWNCSELTFIYMHWSYDG